MVKTSLALGGLLLSSLLCAESVDEALEGFDDVSSEVEFRSENSIDGMSEERLSSRFTQETSSSRFDAKSIEVKDISDELTDGFSEEDINTQAEKKELLTDLSGKLTQFLSYGYNGTKPHNAITSLRSSLFLDYEHKFENNWRFKINAKTYYDTIYDIRNENYSQDELDAFRSEVRFYDAFLEGSLYENIDFKIGRQVVVWGRSDTIRITDVLNPLDNRRLAIVDIEDLRLPVAMAKLDWFIDVWRITPIAILEQHFSLNPPFESAFNPMQNPYFKEKEYNDISYGLSVAGEFSGWDINFYAARIRDDMGFIDTSTTPTLVHDKLNMFGTALNLLSGAWLFKAELAYFDGLKYTTTQNKNFERIDALMGVEYKGVADTLFAYDISVRHLNNYDIRLLNERNPLDENTYQHAFRVSSDFMNASLRANYLISLFGKKLDEGGFQRAWIKYELGEGINTNFGIVDYIGGSPLFDMLKDSDMFFADISYSF